MNRNNEFIDQCPFCGHHAEFEYDEYNWETGEGDEDAGWIKCQNPRCGVGFYGDYETALRVWNTRVKNSD